jgi:hypothetical protein
MAIEAAKQDHGRAQILNDEIDEKRGMVTCLWQLATGSEWDVPHHNLKLRSQQLEGKSVQTQWTCLIQ